MHAAMFALMRGDISRTASNAVELARLARDTISTYLARERVFLDGWVNAESGDAAEGLEDMRRGVELLREQNVLVFDGLFKIAACRS